MEKKVNRKTRGYKRSPLRNNLKPIILILLIPLLVGAVTIGLIASGLYNNNLASFGSNRLVTDNWESAQSILQQKKPAYERKYAYYQVKNGQTIESIADYFGVDSNELAAMNPGIVVAGTTIKLPPIEKPYTATSGSNGLLSLATVSDDKGFLRISHKYDAQQHIITNLPELTQFLAPYNAIEQVSPTVFRINRPISIQGDIRVDITKSTVTKLQLRSSPSDVTCLCFDQSTALIEGVEITSYDPGTKRPDMTYQDGRSFVRMKNGRMDVINSRFSYLGNGLDNVGPSSPLYTIQRDGGVYGVSWRIAGNKLGEYIATGWVEDSTFTHNYFGSYSFGVSGMLWKGDTFAYNDIYGLDLHDDSNNALIEDNVFKYNGKHGFIASKRCNYNIIRNNLSIGNKAHGFMLHEDSAYNLIEDNVASGNLDNYVIFASSFNTLRNNKSYTPSSSHVRINQASHNNFVIGNQLYGGPRGVYLYEGATNTFISGNTIQDVSKKLQIIGAQNTFFADNVLDDIHYDIAAGDRMIFGHNIVKSQKVIIPETSTLLATHRSGPPVK